MIMFASRRISGKGHMPALAGLGLWLLGACAHQPDLPAAPAVIVAPEAGAGQADAPAPVADAEAPAAAVIPVLASLARVADHGLDPEAYAYSQIAALQPGSEAQLAAARQAWLLAASDLRHGALDPDTLARRRAIDGNMIATLDRLEAGGDAEALAAALDASAPSTPAYLALRGELARQRAALAGEKDAGAWFTIATRIDTLRVNLERLRWLPHEAGGRYVLANIPAFEVDTVSDGIATSRHAAIFGQIGRQTPALSDQIEYVVLNPWWEVPESIARHDKLAQFRKDPGTVTRLGYQILDREVNAVDPAGIDWNTVTAAGFPYRIRQKPGPANALGQVKIMFPNAHSVYLHDTPDKQLFDEMQRTFSSGCIRVQDPLDVAEWVLADTPGWGRAEIDATVATGDETRIDLAAPVPVYVTYLTAYEAEDGSVAYFPDVYSRDADVLNALNAALSF